MTENEKFSIEQYSRNGVVFFSGSSRMKVLKNRSIPLLRLCRTDFDSRGDFEFRGPNGKIKRRGKMRYYQPGCQKNLYKSIYEKSQQLTLEAGFRGNLRVYCSRLKCAPNEA